MNRRCLPALGLVLALSAGLAWLSPGATGTPGPRQNPELAAGDVVLRHTASVWARVFARLNERDTRFSHAGVVVWHEDGWRVIHAEADDLGRNGHVRLDDWERFIADARHLAVLRLDDPDAAAATAHAAHTLHAAALPFDLSFDLQRTSAVYCTELVWRALFSALGADPLPDKPRLQGREAILVENLLLDVSELSLVYLAE